MAREWKRTSLREAGVTLIDCDHRTPPAADSGYPYVAIPQLKEGRLALADARRISPEHYADWTRKAKPQHHDVILSRRCNPGETAFVPAGLECALGQNLVLLRSDGTKVFPPFLRWLLNGPDWWEQVGTFINVGAIFNSLKCADIPTFKMPLPPLAEQKAIAAVLGALDDKIELNRRMNATLETLARAIFKSWFVDFDPVRHQAEIGVRNSGTAEKNHSSFHLPPSTLKLFPSTFQDSELGKIPEGWRIETLGDHVELQRGKTYKSKLKGTPGPYLLALGSIERNGGFRSNKLMTYGGDNPENLLVYPGDLYVSLKDVTQAADLLGAVARVPTSIKVGRMTQDTVKLVFDEDAPSRHIVYRTLLTPEYRVHCRSHATGTTNLGLARNDFLSYPLIVPPGEVEKAFDKFMDDLESRIDTNERESLTLSALRDTLLPKLLSGELPVPAALTATEEALA